MQLRQHKSRFTLRQSGFTLRQSEYTRTAVGFTLIELIAVMGVLAVLLAIAAPRLARFFAGRELREESRRLLALTHYARSAAISRSLPLELWVDPQNGIYGLRPLAGFENDEWTPLEFDVAGGLQLEVDPAQVDRAGIAAMLFEPDGALDPLRLREVRIVQDEAHWLWLRPARSNLYFEVSTEEVTTEEVAADGARGR